MKFSLIVATLNRDRELVRLLDSLLVLNGDFEVILIDQNNNNLLDSIIKKYKELLDIKYYNIGSFGVNYARNYGAEKSSGDFLSFPDDDCWYKDNILDYVLEFFNSPECDAVFGRTVDENDKESIANFPSKPLIIDSDNTWTTTIENSFFIRRESFFTVGGFDVKLGPGPSQRYGAHEIDDFVLRALAKGLKFFYNPELKIKHEQVFLKDDQVLLKRAYSYGLGMGYVARRHGISVKNIFIFLIKPILAQIIYKIKKDGFRESYYYITWRSRLLGWQEGNE